MRRRWRSKASKLICAKTGIDDPVLAVRQTVRQLLGNDTGIPIDLLSIAKRLNVRSVLEESLPFDGMLRKEKNRLVIKLNSHSPPLRRRFTLAHELGHVLFADSEPPTALQRGRTCRGDEVERLCDVAASELLMPEDSSRRFFDNHGISPDSVSNFAGRFAVSLQAAARRVLDLRLTGGTFLLLRQQEEFYFSQLWRAGRLRLDSPIFLPSLKDCLTGHNSIKQRVFVETADGQIAVEMEARRLGSSNMILALLSL